MESLEPQLSEVGTTAPDPLAKFREQVRLESEQTKPKKMSQASIERLRANKEQDRETAIAGERFKNALYSVIVTEGNLAKLIERVQPSKSEMRWPRLDRRTRKLHWFVKAGFLLGSDIDSREQILFFSELTSPELEMTDAQFAATWDEASAKKVLRYRIEHGLTPNPEPKARKKRAPNNSYRERLAAKAVSAHSSPSKSVSAAA